MNLDATTPGALLLTASSSLLASAHVAAWVAALRHRRAPPTRAPRVSILKPCAGLDDALRENFESFARLRYPEWEILFGIASPDDPAAETIRAFLRDHPDIDARLVVTDGSVCDNPKVAQLFALEREATGDVVVVSDANVRVGEDYLATIASALETHGGLVSHAIVGAGEKSLGSAIENAQLGGFVAPMVLGAQLLGGRAITVGKSMAMKRCDLHALGGFGVVGGVLAEDDVLGQLFAEAGFAVTVLPSPIVNVNVRTSVARTIERHTRWGKMRRAICVRAFAAEPLLFPSVLATLLLLASPAAWARSWVATAALEAVLATVSQAVLTKKLPPLFAPILGVVRSHAMFVAWLLAWTSRRVSWRGHVFRVEEGSELVRVAAKSDRRVEAS